MKKALLTWAIVVAGYCSFAQDLPLTAGSGYPLTGLLLTNVYNNNQIALNNNGTDYGFITNPATQTWALGHGASLSALGTSVLSWNASGNVGIGLTNPFLPLHVNGTVYSAIPQSNTVGVGTSWANNANYNFLGYSGYWGLRTGMNTSYNLDVYNSGSPITAMTVLQGGNVGIGTTAPDTRLAVNGTIHTKEVKVDLTGWPDYVFKPKYNLLSLAQVKTYIDKHQHLPEMPSEQDVTKNGIKLGEIVKLQTKKIEELTLYAIDQEKRIAALEAALLKLSKQ